MFACHLRLGHHPRPDCRIPQQRGECLLRQGAPGPRATRTLCSKLCSGLGANHRTSLFLINCSFPSAPLAPDSTLSLKTINCRLFFNYFLPRQTVFFTSPPIVAISPYGYLPRNSLCSVPGCLMLVFCNRRTGG